MPAYATLTLSHPAEHVLLVTLNRPDAANALNTQMATELAECFEGLASGTSLRTAVLTGAGGRAFCAGADLKERKGMSEAEWETQHARFRAARDAVLHCPLPVIAAVNGAAYGGGLELALSCDFIYAASTARFALPESTLGIIPGLGGAPMLARTAGTRRAKEATLTGASFSAAEALEWGVANRLFLQETLMQETLAAAVAISRAAPLAVRALKRVIDAGADTPLPQALDLERKAYLSLLPTADRHEGINAFNEKRNPVFKGV